MKRITGTVKTLALTDTKKGIHATADKGIKAIEKCR